MEKNEDFRVLVVLRELNECLKKVGDILEERFICEKQDGEDVRGTNNEIEVDDVANLFE